MAQNFLACDREQSFLFPPDVRDWLPEGHLAWFVIDAVGVIDTSRLRRRPRRDRPEERRLIAHRRQIRQIVAAVGEHDREITDHAPGVMTAAAPAQRTQRADNARVKPVRSATPTSNALPACETEPAPSDVTLTVKRRASHITCKVIPPSRSFKPSASRRVPAQADSPAAPIVGAAAVS